MRCDILVVGSGSVSEATCRALALAAPRPLRVVVLGRSEPWVHDLAGMANAVAGAAGTGVSFLADTIDWDAADGVRAQITRHPCRVIFHTASLLSPWELTGPSAHTRWKALVSAAGQGVMLPLHTMLVRRVAEAAATLSPTPALVNACGPDWVNPVLRHLGLPVMCGTGNVGMFSACLKARYPHDDVRVVGHSYHYFRVLGKRPSHLDGPRVWLNDREILDPRTSLSAVFRTLGAVSARGRLINEIVGATSAKVLMGLLDGAVKTHVPGPNGLPGGYPVVVANGQVVLDLPSGCTEAEAISLNEHGAYDMGATVIDAGGFTRFSPTAERVLAQHAPALAAGFHIDNLDDACAALIALRARLIAEPSQHGSASAAAYAEHAQA